MIKQYGTVEEALKGAGRLLSAKELFTKVNKQERACWRELKSLQKRHLVAKIDLRVSYRPNELCNPTVLYKWIGGV